MKSKPSAKKRPRPSLPKASEQMKAWSAALAAELDTWPNVTTRPMFDFTAYYRRARIFAVLPKTRGMSTPNSLAFKLEAPGPTVRKRMRKDPRLAFTEMAQARWLSFEMNTDADLRAALEWLSEAYEAAGKRR